MTLHPIDQDTAVLPAAAPDEPSPDTDDDECMVIELVGRHAELVEELRTARAAAKRWKKSEELARAELLDVLGPAMGATVAGQVVVRRRVDERWVLDNDALKEKYPEVWAAFRKPTYPTTLVLMKP